MNQTLTKLTIGIIIKVRDSFFVPPCDPAVDWWSAHGVACRLSMNAGIGFSSPHNSEMD